MLHTIENNDLICTIESNGAEIRSLKNKKTGKEYIWQIDESIWGSSSPVLFPAIGLIKDNKVDLNRKSYAMPKHGIIRNNDCLTFSQTSETSCQFELIASEKTKTQYPFEFRFVVEYSLEGQSLHMNYRIENRGSEPMYFTCGGHTAYACPLDSETQLSDYVIEFPEDKTLNALTLGESGLLTTEQRSIVTNSSTLPLSQDLFNCDALIFDQIDFDSVRLIKKGENKGVRVEFSGYPHLALWSKPDADYVCIEPWLGLPDQENESTDLNQKSTYSILQSGETKNICISTIIE